MIVLILLNHIFFHIFHLITNDAQAYPHYIGHGYTSCINCHYNPFGGGPVSDYGRAVSASTLSARHLYPNSVSDETLANHSGFLFNKPNNNLINPQINYRGFQLVNNPGSSNNQEKVWINMQADARLVLKYGENNKVIVVGNVGYTPPPRISTGEKREKWRSREHYAGYKITPKLGVYAGLMDKIFGIRIIEHIAYSRINPEVTQNDQTHGITSHFAFEKWEGGVQYFVGNLTQDKDLRMKGISTTVERTIFDIHRIGASFTTSKNDYFKLGAFAFHGRFNLREGSSLLFEFGQSKRQALVLNNQITSRYGLFQNYLKLARGVYFLSNIEYNRQDIKDNSYTMRWGPGIQYHPMQRVELRFDLYNTRNFVQEASAKDNWMYLLQTHLWF